MQVVCLLMHMMKELLDTQPVAAYLCLSGRLFDGKVSLPRSIDWIAHRSHGHILGKGRLGGFRRHAWNNLMPLSGDAASNELCNSVNIFRSLPGDQC